MGTTFNLTISEPSIRRWDLITIRSSGRTGLVVRKKRGSYGITFTTAPYRIPRNKWVRKLKMWVFKVFYTLKYLS